MLGWLRLSAVYTVGLTRTAPLPGDQNAMPAPSTHGYIDHRAPADLKKLAEVDVVEGAGVTDWSMSRGRARFLLHRR